MINNCGIINKEGLFKKEGLKEGETLEKKTERLINQVYDLYRSPHAVNQL
jgi:hypothetical protein